MEDNSTRRRAFPGVTPNPRSSGSTINLPYVSESSAYSILGFVASHTSPNPPFGTRNPVAPTSMFVSMNALPRVIFNNKLFLHRHIDLFAGRQGKHSSLQPFRAILQPSRQ